MKIAQNSVGSIALGSFDGMHRAHRVLIDRVEAVGVIERFGSQRLTPGYKRTWYCDKLCAFYLFERIHRLDPSDFVSLLLEDFPRLERIVVGYDFRFGRHRQGSARSLQRLFPGRVEVVDEIRVGGIAVHARTIREYLRAGDVRTAAELLGRPYGIDGYPVTGQGLGGRKLVPTINLSVEDYLLPAEGVYATRTRIGPSEFDSVTFLGHRESTDGAFALETHIIDAELRVGFSDRVFVEFHRFLRPNRRFDSLQALGEQIDRDLAEARSFFQKA